MPPKKTAAKKTTAKKTSAKKTSAKKTTAKKTTARKPAVKKPAAKKTAARKPRATRDDLTTLVTRALKDEKFRAALAQDAAGALKAAKLTVSDDRVTALNALSYDQLQSLAAAFGMRGTVMN